MKINRKLIVSVFSGLIFSIFSVHLAAKPINYKLTGTVGEEHFIFTVSYDDESTNIVNQPWAGWTTVLTIPDAHLSVEWQDKVFSSSSGVRILHAEAPFGTSVRFESISDPSSVINTVQIQIETDGVNEILYPLSDLGGDIPFMYGSAYFYLNEIGFYTDPWSFIDTYNSNLAKIVGNVSDRCTDIHAVINSLATICDSEYCYPNTFDEIQNAIGDLTLICPNQ